MPDMTSADPIDATKPLPVKSAIVIDYEHTVAAVGWLSAHLAGEADAWNDNAPEWFPEPPAWLELWNRALAETKDMT